MCIYGPCGKVRWSWKGNVELMNDQQFYPICTIIQYVETLSLDIYMCYSTFVCEDFNFYIYSFFEFKILFSTKVDIKDVGT